MLYDGITKKDFQKTIGAIRKARAMVSGKCCEYPKAMMTGLQENRKCATVNCGGEHLPADETDKIVNMVLGDPLFRAFVARYNAQTTVEVNSYNAKQIRINF